MWYVDELWESRHLNVEQKLLAFFWVTLFNSFKLRSGISIEFEVRAPVRSMWELFLSIHFQSKCEWVQDHPWQINMKNQLIDEIVMLSVPRPHAHRPQTMQWRFSKFDRIYRRDNENNNNTNRLYSVDRFSIRAHDAQTTQAYLVSAQCQTTKTDFSTKRKWKWKKQITKIVSIFAFYLVGLTLSLTNVHSARCVMMVRSP